jgi:hypothetical protein
MQHFLKSPPGTAGTEIVTTKFLDQFFVAVYNSLAAAYLRLRWISLPALTGANERKRGIEVHLAWWSSSITI